MMLVLNDNNKNVNILCIKFDECQFKVVTNTIPAIYILVLLYIYLYMYNYFFVYIDICLLTIKLFNSSLQLN